LELSYRLHLPKALTGQLGIPTVCRGIISQVLNSSLEIIDDLLATEGIGQVLNIEAPDRNFIDDADTLSGDEQTTDTIPTPEGTSRPVSRESDDVPQASRASMAATEHRPAPVARLESRQQSLDLEQDVDPEQEPYPQSHSELELELDLDNVVNLPIRQAPNIADAYTQLLSHVIRIAREADFPRSSFLAAPVNGRYLPGHDALGAFGVRSLNQMSHDSKIGAAGELFVSIALYVSG
jgi:hypothetical protein